MAGLIEQQHIARRRDPTTRALQDLLRGVTHGDPPATLNAPLPPGPAFPEGRLSPRTIILLARALDTRKKHVVRLEGAPLAILACVLARLPAKRRPRGIQLACNEPEKATATLALHLDDQEREAIQVKQVTAPGPDDVGTADAHRLLVWGRHPLPEDRTLAHDGLTIAVDLHGPLPTIHQIVAAEGTTVRIDLSTHVPRLQADRPAEEPLETGVPLRRLLAAERHQQNAWLGRSEGRLERLVADSVRQLFHQGPLAAASPRNDRARLLFHLGYLEQLTATRSGALALYQDSLDARPNSEAWTFIGWLHAQKGHMDAAIDACRSAIETDPTLGNPYNDIGAYLFALKRNDEAKTWFHRAIEARRYAAPHYPYTNLARIHLQEGDLRAAREAARSALDTRGDYAPAHRLMQQIEAHSDSMER